MVKDRAARGSVGTKNGTSAAGKRNGARAAGADPIIRYKRAEHLRMLEQMQVIRHFEERAAEQYTRARIGGYIHLNVGEEATVVGAVSALRPDDHLIASYRSHGHALARGTE